MSRDINKWFGDGHLGSDPISPTENITKISIASNRMKGGEEIADWIPVVFFGKLAEIAKKNLRKGSHVFISGRLQTTEWTKDGVSHRGFEIAADEMKMFGGRNTDSAPDSKPEGEPSKKPLDDLNSKIPF